MVVRIVGTNAAEAAQILAAAGGDIQTARDLDEAVEKAVAIAGAAEA
jgi:succinyl-CoA synthetase beta subunit